MILRRDASGSIERFNWRGFSVAVLAALGIAVAAPAARTEDAPSTSSAQSLPSDSVKAELDQVKAEARRLMQAGQFPDAVTPAKRALALSESIYGAPSLEAAIAAHNLGFLYKRAERLMEAQELLDRARRTYDAKLPAVHEDLRNITGELGQIYQNDGRSEEVVQFYQDLIARAAKEGDSQHEGTAHNHNNLAFLLASLGKGDESQAHWEQAVAIYARQSPPDATAYLLALEALLGNYRQSAAYDKARRVAGEALAKLGTAAPEGRAAAISISLWLADIENAAGRYAVSRELATKALAAIGADGDNNGSKLGEALNTLARAERALANHAAAEGHFKRALEVMETAGKTANAGILSDNLAVLYAEMGRLDQAEPYHKRALQALEDSLGPDHRVTGESAGNFGAFLLMAGRLSEAEPYLLRSLKTAEAQVPQDPVTIAIVCDHLAAIDRLTGRFDDALINLRQSLVLLQKALPPEHPRIATTRNNLGRLLMDTGSYSDAESEFLKALKINEHVYGSEHPSPAMARGNLGDLYLEMGKRVEGKAYLKQAAGILEKQLGRTHTSLLIPLVQSGDAELADGNAKAAVEAYQHAVEIDLLQRTRGAGPMLPEQREMRAGRRAYSGLIDALWQAGTDPASRDTGRALETGQWDTISPAGLALNALSMRFNTDDAGLGTLVRDWQDLAVEWTSRDKRLTEIVSQSSGRDHDLEVSLRDRLGAIDARRADLDRGR